MVGNGGTILHCPMAGSCTPVNSTGVTANLYAIWGVASDVYAVGAGGVILHGTTATDWAKISN